MAVKFKKDLEHKAAKVAESGQHDTVEAEATMKIKKEKKKAGEPWVEVADLEESIGKIMVQLHKRASVCVSAQRTVNLGDYESAKVGVIVTLPCPVEEINPTFDAARAFVEEKMGEMLQDE